MKHIAKRYTHAAILFIVAVVCVGADFRRTAHAVSCGSSFPTDPTRNLDADIEQANQMGYDCVVLASGIYTSPVSVPILSDIVIMSSGTAIIDASFDVSNDTDVSIVNLSFRKTARFTKSQNLLIDNTTHEDTLYINDMGCEQSRSSNITLTDVLVVPDGYKGRGFLGMAVNFTNHFICIRCEVYRSPIVIQNSRNISIQDSVIVDSDQWGILIQKSTDFIVSNTIAKRTADGLRIEASFGGIVNGGQFDQNCLEGIDIDSSDNIFINAVQANNNNDGGIGISDLTSRCVTSAGNENDCPVNIPINNLVCSHLPENIIIKNGVMKFNSSQGIGSDGANGIYIEGNYIYSNGVLENPGDGGWINPNDRCLRRNERLPGDPNWSGAGKMGIYMQWSKGVDIRSNVIDNHCVGVAVMSCQGVHVANNTVTNFTMDYINYNNSAPVLFVPSVLPTFHRNCVTCGEKYGTGGTPLYRNPPHCSQQGEACQCHYVPATQVPISLVSPTPTGTRSHPLSTSTTVPVTIIPPTCTPVPTEGP